MRLWGLTTLVVLGCGNKAQPTDEDPVPVRPAPRDPVDDPRGHEPDPDPVMPPPLAPEFPESTRSLELVRTVGVRLEPGDTAKRIGTIAVDTRVAWVRTQKGKGCKKPWVEVRPKGWICSDYTRPSKRAPMGKEVPYLDRGEVVPGIYGRITAPNSVTYTYEKTKPERGRRKRPAGPVTSPKDVDSAPKLVEGRPLVGSINVRQYDEVVVAGKQYWKISQKEPEFVLRQAISQHRPSLYVGGRLGDDTGWTVPIAFVWPRVHGWGQARTTYRPLAGAVNRTLAIRTPVPILDSVKDKAQKPIAYKIGDDEWIAAADVRVFRPAPPPSLLRSNERWIDVDLDSQILVAYEGELPVYATLVSSGAKDTPTETGVYRMWLKESEADMKGLTGEDPYSVATVPWTQFFSPEKGLALHTAYWHDQFGTRRSHGCLNLAPRDARWLYFWSDPQVPPGWTMAAGVVESPGSIVRVRTEDDPDPPLRGYAKKVHEVRLQNAPVQ